MKSKYERMKERAQVESKNLKNLRETPEYRRVVGLLERLGYLLASRPSQTTIGKVEIRDALEVGRKVEPRILEVLPAAILSSPRSFMHLEDAPDLLIQVVNALRRGKVGPDFEGISFSKMYEAANRPLKDKRRKTVAERRVSKTFRFTPSVLHKIKMESNSRGISQTEYIESLID